MGSRTGMKNSEYAKRCQRISALLDWKDPETRKKREATYRKLRCKTYILIDPAGNRHRTTRLVQFCEKHGLRPAVCYRLASHNSSHVLKGSRFHRGWDCWILGTLKNNRRCPKPLSPVSHRNSRTWQDFNDPTVPRV